MRSALPHCPPPLLTQLPRRASPVAALRASARFSSPVQPRAFCGHGGLMLVPSQVSRSAPCRRGPPRTARPPRARLRQTRSPCSRRRAPARSSCLPFALAGVPILPHRATLRELRRHRAPHTSGAEWLAMLAARVEQARSPTLPRNSLASVRLQRMVENLPPPQERDFGRFGRHFLTPVGCSDAHAEIAVALVPSQTQILASETSENRISPCPHFTSNRFQCAGARTQRNPLWSALGTA